MIINRLGHIFDKGLSTHGHSGLTLSNITDSQLLLTASLAFRRTGTNQGRQLIDETNGDIGSTHRRIAIKHLTLNNRLTRTVLITLLGIVCTGNLTNLSKVNTTILRHGKITRKLTVHVRCTYLVTLLKLQRNRLGHGNRIITFHVLDKHDGADVYHRHLNRLRAHHTAINVLRNHYHNGRVVRLGHTRVNTVNNVVILVGDRTISTHVNGSHHRLAITLTAILSVTRSNLNTLHHLIVTRVRRIIHGEEHRALNDAYLTPYRIFLNV